MREARMERTEYGLAAAEEGWFAVNVRDAAWVSGGRWGDACIFETGAAPFAQVGYTLAVLQPGQPNGLYHREGAQEDFLVLSGECLLLVGGGGRGAGGGGGGGPRAARGGAGTPLGGGGGGAVPYFRGGRGGRGTACSTR